MSAFMMSDSSLKTLAKGIASASSIPLSVTDSTDELVRANAVLQCLWRENVNSLMARYPTKYKEMVGPECPPLTRSELRGNVSWGALAKILACYEYQSCEHSGWEKSDAYRMCRWFAGALLRKLPGYEEQPWG